MRDHTRKPGGTRQWKITITERAKPGSHLVTLQWRRFPCEAGHWDDVLYCQVVDDLPPAASPEDLQSVLAAAVDGEWWESVRASYTQPPRV